MKSIFHVFVFMAVGCLSLQPARSAGPDRDMVFQTAPFQSLSSGVYDGRCAFSTLKARGDFGLGTLNALDGEMVCLDGAFYQVRHDGQAVPIPGAALTPFAMLTFFDEDQRIEQVSAESLNDLGRIIDRQRPTKNLFYALRVEGVFAYIKVRSVPARKKPYPPLAEALKAQTIFEYKNIAGTLVGFWAPAFVDRTSVPGYHFHFISASRDKGGHVLDLQFKALNIQMDRCTGLSLVTPESGDYFSADLENINFEARSPKSETISNP